MTWEHPITLKGKSLTVPSACAMITSAVLLGSDFYARFCCLEWYVSTSFHRTRNTASWGRRGADINGAKHSDCTAKPGTVGIYQVTTALGC